MLICLFLNIVLICVHCFRKIQICIRYVFRYYDLFWKNGGLTYGKWIAACARPDALLLQGLVKMMENHDIQDISVKELTELVDINRGTFYLHYDDI